MNSKKIQLQDSIIHNEGRTREDYKNGDLILSSAHKRESFTIEEGDHSNETTRAVININELQKFVEKAFKEKQKIERGSLTIKETLEAMKKAIAEKAKDLETGQIIENGLANRFITQGMINRASNRELKAPIQTEVSDGRQGQ